MTIYAPATTGFFSLLASSMPIAIDPSANPWIVVAMIVFCTFISEDLTCVTVGLLIGAGSLSWPLGVGACALGIYLGDLWLWGMGRLAGAGLFRWRWATRKLPMDKLRKFGQWFDENAASAVIATRFLPGTRLAVFVAAGALGRKAPRFFFWCAIAAFLWTPLIVMSVAKLGPPVVDPILHMTGAAWLALPVAAVVMFLLLRTVEMSFSAVGRGKLIGRYSKIWRWEFWPIWLFYLPISAWVVLLSLRHRGFTTITAANPSIPHGGFVGESKAQIFAQLPAEALMPYALIEPGEVEGRVRGLEAAMADQGLAFPLILKPDAGQRGAGVRLIRDLEQARRYLGDYAPPVLAQRFHPGPYEAGIFYYRFPDQAAGRIFSITDKRFSYLTGDGVSTFEQLIWKHPRYRMQAKVFLNRHKNEAQRVLVLGESVRLAEAGNHCQGTMFRDGSGLITPELERAIDGVARGFKGFYFGRFDVRYASVAELRAGRGFGIIELNGVTSESTNVYDPTRSLWSAYGIMFRQWSILFEIGAQNRRAGHRATPWPELWRSIREHYRKPQAAALAD